MRPAVGEPLSVELTRATLAVRCNGICAGGSGASPAVAQLLAGMLNEGVHPVIPSSGSVGAADLCLMAHVGLAMIGEGEAEFSGVRMGSAQALSAAGLLALSPGPKDGLAICSANSVSAGTAALALADARALLDCAQISAALSMEGFRAALTPLDPRVVRARPQPGQEWSAAGLRALLAGGSLTEPGASRRLQDPLSFRCASQLHGSLHAALALLAAALEPELNGAADNPLVLDRRRRDRLDRELPGARAGVGARCGCDRDRPGGVGDRSAPVTAEGDPAERPAAQPRAPATTPIRRAPVWRR